LHPRDPPAAQKPVRPGLGHAGPVAGSRYGTVGRDFSQTYLTLDVTNGARYAQGVLRSFRDKDTERVWQRQRVRKLDTDTQRMALRKLLILDAADALGDLGVPPGNRLEKLKGDCATAYSIRINQQWRICFRWTAAGPEGSRPA